ncbi:MAG: sn-glycerol-3-phosphate ABC transporter ATP-binding protein UgpC [Tissierellia bacterium]|nr:sn-glycerol-3-phosphate ABC transporter ATP-binding protein UgpC [Tissierellia bacterium]
MANLKLLNVSKKYDNGVLAIDQLNLHIEDKSFVVFLGPSGSGKSTLLRCISGLEEITSGEIYIDNILVNEMEPKDRDIAMVFQNYALYPHLNVYDNIAFSLKLRGVDKKIIEEKVLNVAKRLEIDDLLKRKPKELSGGQRQRVALGRAVIRDPKVFLMDEPLSNLDARLRTQMQMELAKLHHHLETTTIFVTHDQTEAMTLGDKIVLLNHGELIQEGTPDEIYHHPINTFAAGFIGSPPINLVHTKFKSGKARFYSETINSETFNVGSLEGDYILGIRPENLEIKYGDDFHVVLVENLGNEKIIYVENEKHHLTIRCTGEICCELNQKISVHLKNTAGINIFDSKTGKNLKFKK